VNSGQSEDKIEIIVARLLRMTKQRLLDWEAGGGWNSKGTYAISLPGYSATISSEDSDGLQPFHLQLFDSQGQPFEVISSERNVDGEWDQRSIALAELYDAARRRALNTDVALDGFLEQLNQIEDRPPF
jgi:hypothetical protein